MTTQRLLLLGLTLSATACPGDDNVTASGSTGDTDTGSSTGTTTGAPSTDPPTGTMPTSDGPTSEPDTTTGTTAVDPGTTTGTTVVDPGTTTTGETTAETTGTSTGTTADDTTTGTTADDTTTGTTADDTTTGTTADTDTDTDTTTMGDLDDEIYAIQNGEILTGAAVDVKGVVVTAIATTLSGFMVQEQDGGEFSGCWVFVGAMGPDISMLAVGDEVDITGVTAEFNGGLTEIDASMGTVAPTGMAGIVIDPEPLPIATFTDPVLAEPWEGVHVSVAGAPLTVSMLLPGEEFQVADGDTAVIDNLAYSVIGEPEFPGFGPDATFTKISGPLNFGANTFKLLPRGAADLEGYMPPANPKLGVEMLQPGDLVVTEMMYNPTCASDNCEWIEIFNAAAQPVELLGLVIQDSAENPNAQGKISTSAVVDPGEFVVLGFKTMTTWPYPNPPAAFYGNNPPLNNSGGDRVFLKNSTITIDATASYTTVMGDQGLSWKLDPTKTNAVDNDTAANWCYSSAIFFMTEKGSPAAANEVDCTPLP
jgi:hypothetical protein